MLVAVLGFPFASRSASAAQITNRSLTLQAGATDGGSKPNGVVNHLFTFSLPSTSALGSIKFEYCTTASNPCVMPAGLVTTSATLGSEAGSANTGFSINNTTNGAPYIHRAAAAGINGANMFQLATITNPTAVNTSFFVRITTYASEDTTGGVTDSGIVTASTATQIVLTGTMPESLIFCTGKSISVAVSGIPDCTTATPGAVDFDQLFSPTETATATSQLAASTNGTTGYSITLSGPTLTSGANTIPAMTAVDVSKKGFGQFGMNLRANTTSNTITPALGTDITPASDGAFLKGRAIGDYATPDSFRFDVSGNTIADSATGGAGPTNAQIYTASYIVNVTGSQVAATYTTTLTYVCTATF